MGKKNKTAEAAPLSKKERKALKAREAQLAAELAERDAAKKADKREKKAAKKALANSDKSNAKAAKKGKKDRPLSLAEQAAADAKAEREARRAAKKAAKAGDMTLDEDAAAIAVAGVVKAEKKAAKADLDQALAEVDAKIAEASTPEAQADIDAEIKARVQAKRDERLREAQRDVETNGQVARARKAAKDMPPTESDHVLGTREKSTLEKATAAFDKAEAEADAKSRVAQAVDAVIAASTIAEKSEAMDEAVAAMVAEVVETDHGREFAVGESVTADEFGKPSEAPKSDFETNGNGQYKVARPTDGKLVGYTRVTTYIACLEDRTALEEWKARILLEGVAAIETNALVDGYSIVARVNDFIHRRDVTIAKARKADRKGKLGHGELATYVDGAWSDFKRALDALADEVFEVGGGREKATKGTDIHELCAIAARDGIQPIADKLAAGEITPADLADVEAFLDAIARLGAKIIDVERVVVNDDLKVAGRLDYTAMVKLPGEQRARRRVMDLKTGRVDYGTGKIAQQLDMYAGATGYDLDTHEREDLKLDRAKGILIHLPAGTGKATVHVADLTLGRKGNRLAAEVRAWRNEGKRAIDLKVDVLEEIAKGSES